jgi:hypothetical protein
LCPYVELKRVTLLRGTTIFETKVTCLLSIGLREFPMPLRAGNRRGLGVWKFCRGKVGNHLVELW